MQTWIIGARTQGYFSVLVGRKDQELNTGGSGKVPLFRVATDSTPAEVQVKRAQVYFVPSFNTASVRYTLLEHTPLTVLGSIWQLISVWSERPCVSGTRSARTLNTARIRTDTYPCVCSPPLCKAHAPVLDSEASYVLVDYYCWTATGLRKVDNEEWFVTITATRL